MDLIRYFVNYDAAGKVKGIYTSDTYCLENMPEPKVEITYIEWEKLIQNTRMYKVSEGKLCVDETYHVPTEEELAWMAIRSKRDALLLASDYSDLPSNREEYGEEWYQAWKTYRRALKDLPETYVRPEDVIWPIPPSR